MRPVNDPASPDLDLRRRRAGLGPTSSGPASNRLSRQYRCPTPRCRSRRGQHRCDRLPASGRSQDSGRPPSRPAGVDGHRAWSFWAWWWPGPSSPASCSTIRSTTLERRRVRTVLARSVVGVAPDHARSSSSCCGAPPTTRRACRYTIDGNPTTYWHTDHYRNATFGNLYPGLGLAIQLKGSAVLHHLVVTSTTVGWSAQTYTSADSRGIGSAGHGVGIAHGHPDRHQRVGHLLPRRSPWPVGAAVAHQSRPAVPDPHQRARRQLSQALRRTSLEQAQPLLKGAALQKRDRPPAEPVADPHGGVRASRTGSAWSDGD